MRLLFLTNYYPPFHLGGMELRCHETVERMQARGHACHVITSRYDMSGRSPSERGITRTLYLEADTHHYRPLDFFLRRPWQERANRRALRRTLDAFEPDIIFIWGMWNLSPRLAYWAEQWLPRRVAYSVASYWPIERDAHMAYWQKPARRAWARALLIPARWVALRTLVHETRTHPLALEQIACVSEYVRRKLDDAGVLHHGARVIYNGIDPQPFLDAAAQQAPHDDGVRLIYTGGILPKKGVHTAIEAMGLLRQWGEAQDLHFTLVGSGQPDYEADLEERVAQLGLDAQVTFRGRVPRDQIPDLLSSSQVFLFTSVWEEPIARTVMEAMAAGLAVIATPVGGQSEMLEDGANALVFSPEDPEGLARCMQRVCSNPDLRKRLAEAGRRTVLEQFTLERMVDEMEAWLENIVK